MFKSISALSLLQVVASVTASTSIFISDDFNDNTIDTTLWDVTFAGTGAVVAEQNGRVEFRLGVNTSGNEFGASYVTKQAMSGDFDVQVRFALLDWPDANGVRLGLGLSPDGGLVERISLSPTDYFSPPGEYYLTHFLDGVHGFVPSGDAAGALRLTREGSVIRGYYHNGTDWTLIHAGPASTASSPLAFGIWSDTQAFSGLPVRAAIDDFRVTAIPEPSPLLILLGGGACLASRALRRNKRGNRGNEQ
jgi:hypothetical protein